MGFEQCHPAVNLIYFVTVFFGMLHFQHPVYLLLSFLCALAYSIKRSGGRAALLGAVLLPAAAAFALYYSTYTHFGVTVLRQNMIGNNITLESLLYGAVLGLSVGGTLLWCWCMFSVFSTDKVVYLFGRLSPRLSLFLSIALRLAPRIKGEAQRINNAQRGIGRGVDQGHLFARVRNALRIFSMLISWTIEALAAASASMRSRGSSLRGRTAFSLYRFDLRDRAYVIAMFVGITVTLMGMLLRQTYVVYDPKFLMTPITAMSWLFYLGYTLFCLMPLALELWTEFRFRRARRTVA